MAWSALRIAIYPGGPAIHRRGCLVRQGQAMKSIRSSNAQHQQYIEQCSRYTGKFTSIHQSRKQFSTQQATPSSKVENMDNVDQNIARIEQIFGRTFSNKLLCAEALQMAGENVLIYVGEKECFVKKNKALESVGDTIIDAVLCKTWYGSLDNQGMAIPIRTKSYMTNITQATVLQSAIGTNKFASVSRPTTTSLASARLLGSILASSRTWACPSQDQK
jgi:hypothetical protein